MSCPISIPFLMCARYAPGQFFKQHHDGRFRPITVFIYLNDVAPCGGGETFFPELNLKALAFLSSSHLPFQVVPRKGCAAPRTSRRDLERLR